MLPIEQAGPGHVNTTPITITSGAASAGSTPPCRTGGDHVQAEGYRKCQERTGFRTYEPPDTPAQVFEKLKRAPGWTMGSGYTPEGRFVTVDSPAVGLFRLSVANAAGTSFERVSTHSNLTEVVDEFRRLVYAKPSSVEPADIEREAIIDEPTRAEPETVKIVDPKTAARQRAEHRAAFLSDVHELLHQDAASATPETLGSRGGECRRAAIASVQVEQSGQIVFGLPYTRALLAVLRRYEERRPTTGGFDGFKAAAMHLFRGVWTEVTGETDLTDFIAGVLVDALGTYERARAVRPLGRARAERHGVQPIEIPTFFGDD